MKRLQAVPLAASAAASTLIATMRCSLSSKALKTVPKPLIPRTRRVEKAGALARRLVQGGEKQRLGLIGINGHEHSPGPAATLLCAIGAEVSHEISKKLRQRRQEDICLRRCAFA